MSKQHQAQNGSDATPHEAITAEEVEGTAKPEKRANNAFTELMGNAAKKHKKEDAKATSSKPAASTRTWDPRDGLGVYLTHPERSPDVVEYDDEFVVIRDMYPKASVHMLLLPRDPSIYYQHPLEALSTNSELLSKVKEKVEHLKKLAASELRRQYGQYSASDKPYQTALEDMMSSENPPPPEERDALLSPGRDWSKDIKVGVHTHPSMNHLHIHILSQEMHSSWLKHKKHYLSFNTSFFVTPDELPLEGEEGERRKHPGDWPKWDMKCWRCGKNFGNKFKAMKEHVEEEFEVWKKE